MDDDEYGVTSEGFIPKDFDTLLSDVETSLKSDELFGSDIDFSDNDPLYHLCVPFVEIGAELWEILSQIFYSASPKYAEGNNLSATGKYIGIARKQATKATGIVRFYGANGTVVPSALLVGTETGINFKTLESKPITVDGYVDVAIEAIEAGINGVVPAGTIVKILTPQIGINNITNQVETVGGQDQETDTDFRTRYDESTAEGAGSTVNAIKANLLNVTGVTDAVVTENIEDTQQNGLLPHSIFVLAHGGADEDIAQAIFDKAPAGTQFNGDASVNIADSQNNIHIVKFSRPATQNVWIKVSVSTDASFPVDGTTQIQNALKSYIDNIKLGESVLIYKITTTISNMSLDGIKDISISLSTDGTTYNSSNVVITATQIAITDLAKIEVSQNV